VYRIEQHNDVGATSAADTVIKAVLEEVLHYRSELKKLRASDADTYKHIVNAVALVDEASDEKVPTGHIDFLKELTKSPQSYSAFSGYAFLDNDTVNPIHPFLSISTEPQNEKKISIKVGAFIEILLISYREHLKMVLDMAAIYNTAQVRKAHASYWMYLHSFRAKPIKINEQHEPNLLSDMLH
jgi:hypothetical protein